MNVTINKELMITNLIQFVSEPGGAEGDVVEEWDVRSAQSGVSPGDQLSSQSS